MNVSINTVTSAIRALDNVSCDDVAQILDTLTAKMKDSGFSEIDLDMMDEANGFVCGEMQQ
jgi:hypothetical protein